MNGQLGAVGESSEAYCRLPGVNSLPEFADLSGEFLVLCLILFRGLFSASRTASGFWLLIMFNQGSARLYCSSVYSGSSMNLSYLFGSSCPFWPHQISNAIHV